MRVFGKTLLCLGALVGAFLAATAFTEETITTTSTLTLQPSDERAAQDALPKSKDPLWTVLAKTKIKVDPNKGVYDATFPDEVKKLDGQTLSISGFILPLESTEKFKHFLLSKRTPTCFFCPPGEPNEIVEIYTDKPVPWDENLVTYEGRFGLTDQREAGIFFKMTNAHKK